MDNHRISIPERLTLNKYVQRNEGKYRKEEKKSEGVREKKHGISPLDSFKKPHVKAKKTATSREGGGRKLTKDKAGRKIYE